MEAKHFHSNAMKGKRNFFHDIAFFFPCSVLFAKLVNANLKKEGLKDGKRSMALY
ncbi:hypothetical protein B4119_2525 [Parageobacillus caldoxylosilyticus]|uniref:Uncharacterized protein n=1 Tax=Saccharococcus caldoxylosilyticus TaxID=81408 RepID=A0A150LBH1_9BACL|nr:hypothetical protein B4119_2525 [Parageobacillus caldoxylosilyticus]